METGTTAATGTPPSSIFPQPTLNDSAPGTPRRARRPDPANGSVAPTPPRASHGPTTRRILTIGVDLVADGPIRPESARIVPAGSGSVRPRGIQGRTDSPLAPLACGPGTPARVTTRADDEPSVRAGEREKHLVVEPAVPGQAVARQNPNPPLPALRGQRCSPAGLSQSRWGMCRSDAPQEPADRGSISRRHPPARDLARSLHQPIPGHGQPPRHRDRHPARAIADLGSRSVPPIRIPAARLVSARAWTYAIRRGGPATFTAPSQRRLDMPSSARSSYA
jgi:hypothetical protein